jgi:hypothetical protein
LVKQFNLSLPVTWVELYQNDTLISSGIAEKPIFGWHLITFPKLFPGEYVVKIFRKIGNNYKKYVGVGHVKLTEDLDLHIYCTWEKTIDITTHDQYNNKLNDIELIILKNNISIYKNVINKSGFITIKVPFNIFDSYSIKGLKNFSFRAPFNFSNSYVLKGFYKGFLIYNKEVSMFQKTVDINLDLYDLSVEVRDGLGFFPGVDVRPFLSSPKMYYNNQINPDDYNDELFLFNNLPASDYILTISYGGFSDEKKITIPESGDKTNIKFTAEFNLKTDILNSRGESINYNEIQMKILRRGKKVYQYVSPLNNISLPPGNYKIQVYLNEEELIGSKSIELTSNRYLKIVTLIDSLSPKIVIGLVLIFMIEIIILFIFKKISLNSFLKMISMSLILISIFLPWWTLNAVNDEIPIEKTSSMFIFPQTMIDSILYKDNVFLDLATIPEVFTDFVGILLLIIFSGFILIGISFIPNIVLRRRFSLILISASILFLILVALAFSFGMSTICELSLGDLQGSGQIEVVIPHEDTFILDSNWGLGFGFYLCIFSALILVFAGLVDYLIKLKIININFFKKK